MAASFVSAQVEIVDRRIPSENSPAAGNNALPPPPVVNELNPAELYYQMQVLQQEVMALRGLVEEQSFQLKRLKQQRLDDYLDLDRRLSQVQGGAPIGAGEQTGEASPIDPGSSAPVSQASPADELRRYRSAINLVLKEKKYDDAIVALNAHLNDFPKGRYAANAQYWLGEIFLVKGELEQARQWFSRMLSEFPAHNKVPDAKFKLGKVYHQLGDADRAKPLLQEVANSSANAARLAKDYLSKNF